LAHSVKTKIIGPNIASIKSTAYSLYIYEISQNKIKLNKEPLHLKLASQNNHSPYNIVPIHKKISQYLKIETSSL
jgi:hypothetical protein